MLRDYHEAERNFKGVVVSEATMENKIGVEVPFGERSSSTVVNIAHDMFSILISLTVEKFVPLC